MVPRSMKTLAREFSMTSVIWLAAGLSALAAPAIVSAADSCDATPPARATASLESTARPDAYPTFCSIPPIPADVRGAAAYKADVVATRLAGARLVRATGPDTFSISGTDDFAGGAKLRATPPPPITTPGQADTAAFEKASRARAAPPPRPR